MNNSKQFYVQICSVTNIITLLKIAVKIDACGVGVYNFGILSLFGVSFVGLLHTPDGGLQTAHGAALQPTLQWVGFSFTSLSILG